MTLPRHLPPGTVHLVRIHLRRALPLVGQVGPYLSPEENSRAARFMWVEDRHRHVLGRGVARVILGSVMDCAPDAVTFETGPQGKPQVHGGPSFNISHSGDVIAIALAADGRLGIDVELQKPLRDLLSLARTTFRPDELAELKALPAEERTPGFFRIWTRKEAMLKALGCGLSELDAIAVSASEMGDALREISLPGETVEQWTLRSLELDPDHAMAIAWDRELSRLEVGECSPLG